MSKFKRSKKHFTNLIFGLVCFILGVASSPYILQDFNQPVYAELLTRDQKTSDIGLPSCTTFVNRPDYALSYDHRTKNATWVYENLTADSLNGRADRKGLQFKEDATLPKIFRSTVGDYHKSGFDRGHLAPAANHKSCNERMEDTFYLSNISSQEPQFNRGYWAKLEKHVRDLTKKYNTVEVFTGPLFIPQEDANGKRWVTYQVIGTNDIAVPTHYYKVLILNSDNGTKKIEAYMLPNKEIDLHIPINSFKITLEKIESCSGIKFFQNKEK